MARRPRRAKRPVSPARRTDRPYQPFVSSAKLDPSQVVDARGKPAPISALVMNSLAKAKKPLPLPGAKRRAS